MRPPLTSRARLGRITAGVALALALAASTLTNSAASAADNPYQRGPDPTAASVAATYGPFATSQVTVPAGNGFNGGTIFYPTDTSHGTWGAVAIVPGYSALFSAEEAWMGPRLASFGFVVIGVETLNRTDGADARATQLLAALDYLTQRSAVRDRVDPQRLAVIGHSAGGAGALGAALRRPTLRTVVGLAPGAPGAAISMAAGRVPLMFISGERDTTVTRAYLDQIYQTVPATVEHAWAELTGADHLFATRANAVEMRVLIPWLKIFMDDDTRFAQFLCPSPDLTGLSMYRSTCPLVPPGGTTPPSPSSPSTTVPSTTPPVTTPPVTTPPVTTPPVTTPPATGACNATYRTVNSWSGGFQAEVTVTAGSKPLTRWTVGWSLSAGQRVTQVWNGTVTTTGTTVSVVNAPYNGSVPAAGSVTFGFLADGNASVPSLTCTGG